MAHRCSQRRTRALVVALLLLSLTAVQVQAASASHVPAELVPLAEVAVLDTSQVDLTAFSGQEQSVASYLGLLAPLANSVVDDDATRYGWIASGYWRGGDPNAINARVMENVTTLAYFYSTDRPWNPYYADPALKARLEAALGFWVDMQNADGSFAESAGDTHSRPATAFALDFVSGSILDILATGPGIDATVRARVVEASRRAAAWFLASDRVWGAQGQVLSNQIAAGMVGISRIIHLFPELRESFESRVAFMAANVASGDGGYYYEGGAGHAYSLLVMSDDLALWGDTATRPTILTMQRAYVDWMQYAFLHDAGAGGFLTNVALDTRHGRVFNDVVASTVGANGLWARDLAQAAAYAPSAEQVASHRQRFASGTWEATVVPEIERVKGFLEPRPIRNVMVGEYQPPQADKDAAIASLRYRAEPGFTEHRGDDEVGQEMLAARRQPYLLGMAFGRQPVVPSVSGTGGSTWDRVRFGLTHLWSPQLGMLVQSQNALTFGNPRDIAGYQGLEWATVAADGDGTGSKVDAHQQLVPTYTVAGSAVAADAIGAQDFRVAYAPSDGWVTKTVDVAPARVTVSAKAPGAFWEQIPLVLAPGDTLTWLDATTTPAYGVTGQRASAIGLVVERGGEKFAVRWGTKRSVDLDAVDPVACRCGLFAAEGLHDAYRADATGQRRIHLLKVHATDALTYSLRFGDTADAPDEPAAGSPSPTEPAPAPSDGGGSLDGGGSGGGGGTVGTEPTETDGGSGAGSTDDGATPSDGPSCETDGAPSASFTDVAPDSIHRRSIDCAVDWTLAQGITDELYAPERTVTRAQMASFVVRLLTAVDAAPPASSRARFSDVGGNPHATAIEALAEAGLVNGDGSGRYGPNESVTRAQIATMIVAAYEYATGEPLPAGERVFTDVDGNPHRDNIEAAAAAGITSGVGGGRYDPSGRVRRDQMATLLVGLSERVSAAS